MQILQDFINWGGLTDVNCKYELRKSTHATCFCGEELGWLTGDTGEFYWICLSVNHSATQNGKSQVST